MRDFQPFQFPAEVLAEAQHYINAGDVPRALTVAVEALSGGTKVVELIDAKIASIDFEKDEQGNLKKTTNNRYLQVVVDYLNDLKQEVGA